MTVKPHFVLIFSLFLFVLVLSGCKGIGSKSDLSQGPSPTPTPAVDPKDVYVSELLTNVDIAASKSASAQDKQLVDGRTTILADVNGGDLRGEGGIYRNFGVYNVYAKVKLGKPSGSNFYQAWVMNPSTKQYFSIGKMEIDTAGNYNVSYNTDNIHPGFDRIVVTLESQDDTTPEKHIVEGTLDNTLQPAVAQ